MPRYRKPLLTVAQREQMKVNGHYDPLRSVLRGHIDLLRAQATRIGQYLSSPAQCSEHATRKLLRDVREEAAREA